MPRRTFGLFRKLLSLTPPQSTSLSVEPMVINAIQPKTNMRLCYHCDDRHAVESRFVNTVCRYSKKKCHLEKICLSKKKNGKRNVDFTNEQACTLNGVYCVQLASKISRVTPYEEVSYVHVAWKWTPAPASLSSTRSRGTGCTLLHVD